MLSSVISLLVLGLLVIVHELGHFVVARWSGVRILRFSIGFGPRLFTWTRGETEYAVSAIPLGGYVKMAGEQRKPHQQTKEVGDRYPFVSEMTDKAVYPDAGLEAGEQNFVTGNNDESGEGNKQRVSVKKRHAEQGDGEQIKIDGNTEKARVQSAASRLTKYSGRRPGCCFLDAALDATLEALRFLRQLEVAGAQQVGVQPSLVLNGTKRVIAQAQIYRRAQRFAEN